MLFSLDSIYSQDINYSLDNTGSAECDSKGSLDRLNWPHNPTKSEAWKSARLGIVNQMQTWPWKMWKIFPASLYEFASPDILSPTTLLLLKDPQYKP